MFIPDAIRERASEAVKQLDQLQPAIDWLEDFSNRIFGQGIGRKASDFLNGTWLGHPLHPAITDVPIGAWTTAVVLDQMEMASGNPRFGTGADIALGIGEAGAAGAAVAGLADWRHTNGEAKRQGFIHAALNTTALTLMLGSTLLRRSGQRPAGRALAVTGYLIAGFSAYLGGDLVFRKKIGVNHAPLSPISSRYTDVCHENDLIDGKPQRFDVDDVPVMLVRRGGEVFALAEKCAHQGGPLSEGDIRENNTVVCPWHGSEFKLWSGEVVHGPSAYPQPCYQVRIRDHRVEVRNPPRAK